MSINMPIPNGVGHQYTASNDVTYVWDGQKWISIGSTSEPILLGANPGPNPPSNPYEGMLWYDTTNDVLTVRVGSTWEIVTEDLLGYNS